MPFQRRRTSTRTEIIRLAARLFIEEGYTVTSANKIAKALNLSPGNITFYFPTKEHLLAVLVDELCDFQRLLMEHAAEEGKSSLLSYCLELASIAAICKENEVARDLYVSAYSSVLTLDIIRKNDTQKIKKVFSPITPTRSEKGWEELEDLISGIEYATIMTREAQIPLAMQIEGELDAVMLLCGVDEALRKKKIEQVLAVNYRALGRRILHEFKAYLEETNETALKIARDRQKRRTTHK